MPKEVTLDEMYELVAYADGLKEKAMRIIERMKAEKKKGRGDAYHDKMAEIIARREKIKYSK